MAKARTSLQECEVVISGRFIERTAAESSTGADVSTLMSNHDEADTRIILHATVVAREGYAHTIIACRDTDVLVLLVHFASKLSDEIWFRTGTANQQRFVSVHDMKLKSSTCKNLPAYHAVTGCDTVSQLCGLGKKSTWKVFLQHDDLLDDLGVGDLTDTTMANVEEFVCRLYNVNKTDTAINDIRYKLFQKGTKDPGKNTAFATTSY